VVWNSMGALSHEADRRIRAGLSFAGPSGPWAGVAQGHLVSASLVVVSLWAHTVLQASAPPLPGHHSSVVDGLLVPQGS
jgi:hypothetical protein